MELRVVFFIYKQGGRIIGFSQAKSPYVLLEEEKIREAGIRVGNNVVYPGEGAFYEYQAAQGGRRRSRKMRKGRKMRKSTQKRRM